MKQKLFTLAKIILVLSILMIGCDKNNKPNETKIMEDLQNEYAERILMDWSDSPLTENFSIESVVIEKAQEYDQTYDAWCTVELDNDYYHFTVDWVCDYTYYSKGGWILDSIYENSILDYTVKSSPFDESYMKQLITQNDDNTEVQDSYVIGNDTIAYKFNSNIQYTYANVKKNGEKTYTFDGTKWNSNPSDIETVVTWDICGYWEEIQSYPYHIDTCQIDSFDQVTHQLTGYYIDTYTEYGDHEKKTYDLANIYTVKVENDTITIYMENKSYTPYLSISYDSAVMGNTKVLMSDRAERVQRTN